MQKYSLIFLFLIVSKMAISQYVSGVVYGFDNQTLVGAHVRCDSLNAYAVSDDNGGFILKIEKQLITNIEVSFIGYKRAKFKVNTFQKDTFEIGSIFLHQSSFATDGISIVASRKYSNTMTIPANISVVSLRKMEVIASDKIDQNLKYLPGVYVDRPFGIFGKSVVGIRSVVSSEPARQLTLIDGVPINKSDGGGTNWNRIIESDFQQIEILKGPGAAPYGNNAMGGAINLIHKRPYKKAVQGSVKSSYSSFNTFESEINIQHKLKSGEKSFYYTIAAKLLKSDGYVTVSDSIREKTDTSVFLIENGVNTRFGYLINASSYVEFEYNYYDEKRGQGTKVLLEDGAVARYKTHFAKLNYHNHNSKIKYDINAFYQLENYGRDIEKMKKGNYSHILVNAQRKDYGLTALAHYVIKKHTLSFGGDFRNGSVFGTDDYQQSTDRVINQGHISVIDFYLQNKWQIATKLKTTFGIHFASGFLSNASFTIENPTAATKFMIKNFGKLSNKSWNGISPKMSFQYDFNENMNVYGLYSHAYRTPSLDDMTRYGFINIGYKNANPNLNPEQLDNIEFGYRKQTKFWAVQTNVYYAQGHDFLYYVATGETLFGGRKKVYQKENVTTVYLYGSEVNMDIQLTESLQFSANYTYSGSEIAKFKELPELEKKHLAYVPSNMANFTLALLSGKIISSVNVHYQGNMFLDESNLFIVNPLWSLDVFMKYEFYKTFSVYFSIQNIFNEQHLVSNDQISLGRYISGGLVLKF